MKHLLRYALLAAAAIGSAGAWAQEDGDYVIQNVETGQFLSMGNAWNTQLTNRHYSLLVTLEGKGNNQYTIDTKMKNGANQHFVGTEGYVDQAAFNWTFTKVGDDVYTISKGESDYLVGGAKNSVIAINGTDPNAKAAQWRLISLTPTKMATATADNPVDVSGFIRNQNMNAQQDSKSGITAWTITGATNTEAPANFAKSNNNETMESWQSTNGFKIVQTDQS